MRAAYAPRPGVLAIRTAVRPAVGPADVLVRIRACGICGSDLHFYSGTFPVPTVCPGHEMSGEIVEIGAAVLTVREGDRVAIEPVLRCGGCSACVVGDYQLCGRFRILGTTDDGGFAEFVRTPAYTAFPLPAALDFELGALAEPLAVGVHGVRLGGIGTGQRVVILGAGTIGLLAILAARASGAAHVAVTARHPHQAAAARALGADVVFPADDDGTAGLLAAAAARPVDAVIETVGGGASTLTDALRVVRKGGWIVVLGVFTTPPVLEPILLTLKEPRIVGSLTYGRSGPRADFEVALEILARDPERARTLITHRFPLDAIDTAFATAADKRQRTIKVTIT